jgi:gliding motility-associated-like protein
MMKKILLLSFLIIGVYQYSLGQCGGVTLTVLNPSFEGTPQPHITPPNWDICEPGTTPDTQPGSWGITLPAYCGSTYVGFVDSQSLGWHEGASQTLSSPMVAGTQYCFTAALATTASTGGGILPGCVGMQCWGNMGGNSGCDMTELLWSSGDIFDAAHMDQWVLTPICFTPTQNWSHLYFRVQNFGCSDQPYVMMDCLSPIVPISDNPGFDWTSTGGGAGNVNGADCFGQTVNFTDTSNSPQSTIVSWFWDFGDGTTSNVQNPNHTFPNPGTYNVSLTIVTAVPCTTNVVTQLTIQSQPTCTISGGGSLCTGSSATVPLIFNFTGTGPWNVIYGNGVISDTLTGITSSPDTVWVSQSQAGVYTVTSVSNAYCIGNSATNSVSGSAIVTATNLPNVTLGNFPLACLSAAPFPLTGGSPSGGVYSGTGVSNNIFDPSIPGVGFDTITYTYTDPAGCIGSAQQLIQVATDMPVFINPPDAIICLGNSVNLQCTAAETISWTPTNGLSDSTSAMIVASPETTTTYTVFCQSQNGCTGTSSATITVFAVQSIHFTAEPASGCEPLKVLFNYTPGPDIIDSSWYWTFDDVLSDTGYSTQLNPMHTFSTNGSYDIMLNVTTTAGCPGKDSLTINVYPNPVANFIMHPDIAGMEDPTISFSDISTHASLWSWTFDDPESGNHNWSILKDPVHVYSDSGTYHVTLIVESDHGCRDTVTKPISIYPELLVYVPNAFTPDGNGLNDIFKPTISGIYFDTYRMELFDRWGKEVFKTTDIETGWNGRNGSDKVCGSGVFAWVIHFTDLRGKAYKMLGHVIIIK